MFRFLADATRATRVMLAATAVGSLVAIGGGGVALASPNADPSPKPSATTATHPLAAWYASLTDAQRTCLKDQGITKPTGHLTAEQKKDLLAKAKKAADTCHITLPGKAKREALKTWAKSLTPDQRSCLKKEIVNRPWGPLTKDERTALLAKVKTAAEKCGAPVPTLP